MRKLKNSLILWEKWFWWRAGGAPLFSVQSNLLIQAGVGRQDGLIHCVPPDRWLMTARVALAGKSHSWTTEPPLMHISLSLCWCNLIVPAFSSVADFASTQSKAIIALQQCNVPGNHSLPERYYKFSLCVCGQKFTLATIRGVRASWDSAKSIAWMDNYMVKIHKTCTDWLFPYSFCRLWLECELCWTPVDVCCCFILSPSLCLSHWPIVKIVSMDIGASPHRVR